MIYVHLVTSVYHILYPDFFFCQQKCGHMTAFSCFLCCYPTIALNCHINKIVHKQVYLRIKYKFYQLFITISILCTTCIIRVNNILVSFRELCSCAVLIHHLKNGFHVIFQVINLNSFVFAVLISLRSLSISIFERAIIFEL